jgi:radical SAM protein with 4Fe4S-binding SPASM domain
MGMGGNYLRGKRKLHVEVDGGFQPCERTGLAMEIGGLDAGIDPMRVGAIQKESFEAIQEHCGTCWALRQCGFCYAVKAEMGAEGRPVNHVINSVCDEIKRSVESDFGALVQILDLPKESRGFMENSIVE